MWLLGYLNLYNLLSISVSDGALLQEVSALQREGDEYCLASSLFHGAEKGSCSSNIQVWIQYILDNFISSSY